MDELTSSQPTLDDIAANLDTATLFKDQESGQALAQEQAADQQMLAETNLLGTAFGMLKYAI